MAEAKTTCQQIIDRWARLPVEDKIKQLDMCIATYPDGHRERMAYETQRDNLRPVKAK